MIGALCWTGFFSVIAVPSFAAAAFLASAFFLISSTLAACAAFLSARSFAALSRSASCSRVSVFAFAAALETGLAAVAAPPFFVSATVLAWFTESSAGRLTGAF